MNQVSLAITHYNRFRLFNECVFEVLQDERVGEIVVSDDHSIDQSYEKLQIKYADHPKVKFFRNPVNLDCHGNKGKAVERATLPWVILFDSDNILKPNYLDVLYSLPAWDKDVLYCPEFAEPHFDYTQFAGLEVTKENVSQHMGKESMMKVLTRRGYVVRPALPKNFSTFRTALNTCNYFVHRESYLSVFDATINPHTADSIYQAYRWLASGRRLTFVKGLRYFHRVHDESHYKRNVHKTGNFHGEVVNKLIALT